MGCKKTCETKEFSDSSKNMCYLLHSPYSVFKGLRRFIGWQELILLSNIKPSWEYSVRNYLGVKSNNGTHIPQKIQP